MMEKRISKLAVFMVVVLLVPILFFCIPQSMANAAVNGIIIDNADVSNPYGTVTKVGTINDKTDSSAYNGSTSYIGTTSGNDSVTYTPNIATAGSYKIYAWWPSSGYQALFTVTSNSGTTALQVSQLNSVAGQWNELGTFSFNTGTSGNVKITGPQYTRADAVKFVYVASLPTAANVKISGSGAVGSTLTGTYTFSDPNGGTESGSTYQWYSYDTTNTANPPTPIAGATGITYTPISGDAGKAIAFEVTPRTASQAGAATRSSGVVVNSSPLIQMIDDNTSGFTYGGGFGYVSGNGASGGYHTNLIEGAIAHYQFNVPATGYYRVYAWTDPSETSRPITKYTISGELTWESKNSGTAGWHLLSISSFTAGANTIDASADSSGARFDDLKIQFDSSSDPTRGRVKIENGTVVTDRGTLLRGMVGGSASLEDMINARDNLGINAIHIYVEGGYDSLGNPTNLSTVGSQLDGTTQIVRKARQAGMYVVMTTNATKNSPFSINKDYLTTFWSKYAAAFKNDTHVVFEVDNEPAPTSNYSSASFPGIIDAEAASFKTIRDNAPNSHIIIFTYEWLLVGASNSQDPSYLNAANPDMLTNLTSFANQLETNYGYTAQMVTNEFATNASVGYHAYDLRAWRNNEGSFFTIDDSDTNNPNGTVTFSGSPTPYEVTTNNHAANGNYHTIDTAGTASATFIPNIQTAGTYKIYGKWDANSSRPTNVSFQIWSNGVEVGQVLVDQTKNGYGNNYIGTYTFNAGFSSANAQIVVTGGQNVCLDEIRVQYTTITDDVKLDRRRTEIIDSLESMKANGYAVIATELPADQSNYNWSNGDMVYGIDVGTMAELGANTSWLSFVGLKNAVNDPTEFKDPIENTTDRKGNHLRWQPDFGTWPNTIVLDDSDTNNPEGTVSLAAGGFTKTGDTDANKEDITVHGEFYTTSGTSNITATYSPKIPVTGNYKLYGRWNSASSRPSNVSYQIYSNGTLIGSSTVNQQVNGGQWNEIADDSTKSSSYALTQGANVQIIITGGQWVSIDAIKLVYDFGSQAIPDIIVDDSDTNNPDGSVIFTGSTFSVTKNPPSGDISPYNGNLHSNSSTVDATATYVPNVPKDGWYDLSICWDNSSSRPDGVSYSLYRNGQMVMNQIHSQKSNGGQWSYFGRYYLQQGNSPDINKITITGGQYVSFDAVKLSYVTDDPTLYLYQ